MPRTVIKTPDQRLRVFISSTLKECADERAAAQRAVEGLRLIPVLFELGARPHPPRDLYRSYLKQSDVFVGIYWQSYGWVAPGEDISGLEDEYRLAGDMPKLIYIKSAEEREERLTGLIERITQDDTVSYKRFSNADELKRLVEDDLALMLTETFAMSRSVSDVAQADERVDLPVEATPFIGRGKELDELEALIADPDIRLITLTGPGGIGKTRLAFEVARRAAPSFAEGVGFALLAATTDSHLAIPAIAQALGVVEGSERSVLGNIKEYLRDKELLLLLDNFEHVVEAGTSLPELLADCPGLKILVTSRAALRLRSEREFPVPPLAAPTLGRPSMSEIDSSDAVQLFVERARAANPSFQLNEQNAMAVAEIAARLDGLPLAIELAAARTRLLTPEAMLPRLANSLELLSRGPRDLPERQQTLRSLLDWDYELLNEEEQRGFRRLAVFAGGFTLEAAEAVIAGEGQHRVDPLDVVESLVNKSLLRDESGSHPRFSMLRTIREYAFTNLDSSGETGHIKDRHARFYLALAEEASPKLREADQVTWLDILELEHDNMRAALRWSIEDEQNSVEMRLCAALGRFWEYRSYLSEGQRWLEGALSRDRGEPNELRARVLECAGVMARGQGEFKRATALMEECIGLRRELGDQSGLANAIKNLAIVYSERNDLDRAKVLHQESLDLRKEIGDKRGIAEAQNNLGVMAAVRQQWAEAAPLFEEALQFFRARGDKHAIGRVLLNLGEARLELGDPDEATGLIRESLEICQESGSHWDICDLLEVMASILRSQGRPLDGARILGAAFELREFVGAPLPPSDRPSYERRLALIKDALDPEEFDTAWKSGREMKEEEAIAFALTC